MSKLPAGVEHDRRGEKTGPYNQCPFWNSHTDFKEFMEAMNKKVDAIISQNQDQMEILTAWNNGKVVIKTTKLFGKVIIGLAALGGAVIGLFHWGAQFIHWMVTKP